MSEREQEVSRFFAQFLQVMYDWETENLALDSMESEVSVEDFCTLMKRQLDRKKDIFERHCIYAAEPKRFCSLSGMREYLPEIEKIVEFRFWSDLAVTVRTESVRPMGLTSFLYDLTKAGGEWRVLDTRRRFEHNGDITLDWL